jgi:hypothetical protein
MDAHQSNLYGRAHKKGFAIATGRQAKLPELTTQDFASSIAGHPLKREEFQRQSQPQQ